MCARIRVWVPVSARSSDDVGAPRRVKIAGAVDLGSAKELEIRLRCVLSETDDRALVIDLEDVEFLAACGVSVLLVVQHCAAETGRDVRMTNAQGSPARMLRLLGFDSWCADAAVAGVEAVREQA